MHDLILGHVIKVCQQRDADGDCPTVSPCPAELLEDAVLTLRARAEKAEAEIERLREALELAEDVLSRAPHSTGIWANGMHPNTGVELIRAALRASRPDPAQPGQSSAQPAAERECKICNGANFVHGADGLTTCPACVDATPPAAGSAAGKGGGS